MTDDERMTFIAELESRSMSTWTDAEIAKYMRLTGQVEYFGDCIATDAE